MPRRNLFTARIVGSFARDCNVVGVTFLYTGVGDAGEFGTVQRFDRSCTAITHTRTETTDKLVDDFLHTAFERYTTRDAFGHELLHTLHTTLEITILRTVFHGL